MAPGKCLEFYRTTKGFLHFRVRAFRNFHAEQGATGCDGSGSRSLDGDKEQNCEHDERWKIAGKHPKSFLQASLQRQNNFLH